MRGADELSCGVLAGNERIDSCLGVMSEVKFTVAEGMNDMNCMGWCRWIRFQDNICG